MARFKKSAPWITFYREIAELFKYDDEIKVVYYEDDNRIKIYVENDEKAAALEQVLPVKKVFGNEVLYIEVVAANKTDLSRMPVGDLWYTIADGNAAIDYVQSFDGVFKMTYVVFAKKVVQYFDDNLGDVHGNCSTLYQEIAKDVFEPQEGVFFCTSSNGVEW